MQQKFIFAIDIKGIKHLKPLFTDLFTRLCCYLWGGGLRCNCIPRTTEVLSEGASPMTNLRVGFEQTEVFALLMKVARPRV